MPANSQPWLVQGSLALATLGIAVASLCFGQYPLSLSAVTTPWSICRQVKG